MFDLRSDTVTKPTEAMRAAAAAAEVGDDVFGEDPTVARLEAEAAKRLGKAAGLFVPSGTMGNQVCLGALTRRGDEVIAEAQAHVLLNEGGAAARLWGCQIRTVTGERGVMDPDDVVAMIRDDDDLHHPRTAVLSIENTHNFAGGVALPLEHIDAMAAVARDHGLALHVDGARLFNAAVASGVDAARLVRDADLVSVCLSKGLGAPVGSVVVGDAETVSACRRLRKALGGGMRQAGVIAAPALIALQEGPGRLAEDHRRARALAEALAELPRATVDLETVQTNIVIVEVGAGARDLERRFAALGVRVVFLDDRRLRFTFHRDAGDDALDAALAAVRKLLG